ncbi:MAG: calcium-binding protein [Natronomonas sp.]
MKRTGKDEERKNRIEMEIIVDAYTQDEQAMGWKIYLEETMDVPFEARCIEEREVSPLTKSETVPVVGVPRTEPTLHQQFVTVEWKGRELGVPLRQLEPVDASDDTEQAISDWHYWLGR